MGSIDDHDWSTGGPYVYHCVEMSSVTSGLEMEQLINNVSRDGWEYVGTQEFNRVIPQGFFTPDVVPIVVFVFRAPRGAKLPSKPVYRGNAREPSQYLSPRLPKK